MSKIWRVEEEQIMKAGKIVGINYTVWYKDENGTRTARREYRHGHYKVIPMTVLNFILDESNEANTKYQEFDGCIYKRTMYQEEKKMENINMTTAQEDIEDAIKFGWIEAQETTNTTDTEEEEEENTMNKPNFIIKCIQFHHDDNFKMIGDPIYREFAGSTLKEAKAAWKAARDNNDVVKFSPLTIYDIINSEEE